MIFKTHTPAFPLSQFVESIWFYEGYAPQFTKEKILPDGAIEWMIDLTDEPKKLFERHNLTNFKTYRNSWVSGERTGYIFVEQCASASMIGVRFRPGGAYPFFSFPISDINDTVVELDMIYGSAIHDLRDQILDTPSVEDRFSIIESFLIQQARRGLEADVAIDYALKQILFSPQLLTVRELAGRIGISQKHLIAKFDRIVGLTPKLLARITKFQNVIQRVGHQSKVDWSDISYSCGYYDQSHFIKDFTHFSGINPSVYLVERGDHLNTISVRV